MQQRINPSKAYGLFPALPKGLTLIADAVEEAGLEERLVCLLELRASQINGCGYCLDMHNKHARGLANSNNDLMCFPLGVKSVVQRAGNGCASSV